MAQDLRAILSLVQKPIWHPSVVILDSELCDRRLNAARGRFNGLKKHESSEVYLAWTLHSLLRYRADNRIEGKLGISLNLSNSW